MPEQSSFQESQKNEQLLPEAVSSRLNKPSERNAMDSKEYNPVSNGRGPNVEFMLPERDGQRSRAKAKDIKRKAPADEAGKIMEDTIKWVSKIDD